jgi:hypothetical protein
LEVVKINCSKIDKLNRVKIYSVKISQNGSGCYDFCIKHTGEFNLKDYEEIEFDVNAARLVKKN